jgi:hypothetical protein
MPAAISSMKAVLEFTTASLAAFDECSSMPAAEGRRLVFGFQCSVFSLGKACCTLALQIDTG